jgi:hypothetical protein
VRHDVVQLARQAWRSSTTAARSRIACSRASASSKRFWRRTIRPAPQEPPIRTQAKTASPTPEKRLSASAPASPTAAGRRSEYAATEYEATRSAVTPAIPSGGVVKSSCSAAAANTTSTVVNGHRRRNASGSVIASAVGTSTALLPSIGPVAMSPPGHQISISASRASATARTTSPGRAARVIPRALTRSNVARSGPRRISATADFRRTRSSSTLSMVKSPGRCADAE